MCGRFTLAIDGNGLLHGYVASSRDRAAEWEPVYSIAPRTMAPIVREHADENGEVQRTLEMARWGFQPAWAKEKGPRPINARLETVASNGMFRAAFTSSRAVVPMTGYYEWVETDTGKQPYFIHHPGGELLSAAGLTTAIQNGDDWAVTFTIITREARDAGGEVHDRMPVFLTDDAVAEWLAPGKLDADAKAHLQGELEHASETIAHELITYPVDREVNNVRTLDRADATLIDEVDLGR